MKNNKMEKYPSISESYELNNTLTENILLKNGFNKSGVFRCFIYKNIIQLIIQIDLNENWWDYQVYDVDTQSIYPPYYDRDSGKHLEVEEIDKKIESIINLLVKNDILIKIKE